jgi:hypothetical protein
MMPCLIAAMLSTPAGAASQYVILGAGSRPCGDWLHLRAAAAPEGLVLQSWLLGYVTSVNANVLTTSRDVADVEKLFAWVDDYCAAHPLDSIARAAAGLIDSLRAKNQVR